jgi:putative transposase
VRAVRTDLLASGTAASVVKVCTTLGVARSTAYYQPKPALDEGLVFQIRSIITRFPSFGIRRVWAWLKHRMGVKVNKKTVARLMRLKGWTMKQRRTGLRPRVAVRVSAAAKPDQRWATDVALVFCGPEDGWCSFVPVTDCCTRECLGWELALTARSKTAERALEAALLGRFGWTRGAPEGLVLRSDNGLVFGSRHYMKLVREYRLRQEFITPYTPEENGLVERFIRSFKEECAWVNRFESLEQARMAIGKWVGWYNTERPHQALGYKTPKEVRQEYDKLAA